VTGATVTVNGPGRSLTRRVSESGFQVVTVRHGFSRAGFVEKVEMVIVGEHEIAGDVLLLRLPDVTQRHAR
jgi:hypothetical protein